MKSKNKYTIPIALLILPHFDPNLLTQDFMPGWIDLFIKVLQCSSIVASIFMIKNVLSFPRFKVLYTFFIFCTFITLLISTFINGNGVIKPLFYLAEIIAVLTISSYFVYCKNALKTLIAVISDYFFILATLDILSLLMIPKTMENYWLFGGKNNHIYFVLPFLFFQIVNIGLNKKISFKSILLPVFIAFLIIKLEGSVTALFALVLTSLFLLYYSNKTDSQAQKSLFHIKHVFLGSLIISIIFIISQQISLLEMLIIYFDKEETFGRFGIWEMALDFIKQRPLLGYGYSDIDEMSEIFRMDISHCHNKYVDVLYMTGIVGFACFVLSLFFSFTKAPKGKIQLLLSIVISAYAIEFMTEGKRVNLAFYFILFLYPVVTNEIDLVKSIKNSK